MSIDLGGLLFILLVGGLEHHRHMWIDFPDPLCQFEPRLVI